jgi:hypothetical protein
MLLPLPQKRLIAEQEIVKEIETFDSLLPKVFPGVGGPS